MLVDKGQVRLIGYHVIQITTNGPTCSISRRPGPATGGLLPEIHEDVPGLLHRPCGGRVGSDADEVNAAVVVLDNEQHVEPAQ